MLSSSFDSSPELLVEEQASSRLLSPMLVQKSMVTCACIIQLANH